jgi:hypothetical protein
MACFGFMQQHPYNDYLRNTLYQGHDTFTIFANFNDIEPGVPQSLSKTTCLKVAADDQRAFGE